MPLSPHRLPSLVVFYHHDSVSKQKQMDENHYKRIIFVFEIDVQTVIK